MAKWGFSFCFWVSFKEPRSPLDHAALITHQLYVVKEDSDETAAHSMKILNTQVRWAAMMRTGAWTRGMSTDASTSPRCRGCLVASSPLAQSKFLSVLFRIFCTRCCEDDHRDDHKICNAGVKQAEKIPPKRQLHDRRRKHKEQT